VVNINGVACMPPQQHKLRDQQHLSASNDVQLILSGLFRHKV